MYEVGMEIKMEEKDEDCFSWLDQDVIVRTFKCLDDPADLARASSVSHLWRNLIISNALLKQLWIKRYPQLSAVIADKEVDCSSLNERDPAAREHTIYAFLAPTLISAPLSSCISSAIYASTTDHYPLETVYNTLNPRPFYRQRLSYWSSTGQDDPSVAERLIYKLVSNFCIISEVKIRPFEAYYQLNSPIYSAKAVRFRMGHQAVPMDMDCENPVILHDNGDHSAEERFVWTYTSPEFPMAQENSLQNFKLPQPVLCIGGMLQIELLGRVQRQPADNIYYICVTHVQAIGRSLSPIYVAHIIEPSGRFVLSYNPPSQITSPDCN